MKFWFFAILGSGLSVLTAMAQPPAKTGGFFSLFSKKPPAYVSEAALPEGWPLPGPYDQVVKKSYPAYRAAYTPTHSPNNGFWTLFKHIKKSSIPMTAPVEMTMTDGNRGPMEMEQMGFIYRSREVGNTGTGGENIVVRDVPACTAYSYTWQGPRNDETIAKARAATDAALAAAKVTATGYRILSYNSPFVRSSKQTHELQALIEPDRRR